MDEKATIADVKAKISAVAAQHDIPEAADDCALLLNGKLAETDATLASLVKEQQQGSTTTTMNDGLSFHLVYSIGDNEWEPVEVEPTRVDA